MIMVLSTLQFWIDNQDMGVSYDRFEFTTDPATRMFVLHIKDMKYSFYSFPSEIDHYKLNPQAAKILRESQLIVVTFNPEMGNLDLVEQAGYDIMKYTGKSVMAVTKNVSEYSAFPVYTCADAQVHVPVVFLNISDNASIEMKGSCIVLNANNSEILLLRDRLLYSYLGVIDDSRVE